MTAQLTTEQAALKAAIEHARAAAAHANETARELKSQCAHIYEPGGWSGESATCAICNNDGGWYCPDSPDHLCNYEGYDEDCVYCGDPEERK